MDENEKTAQSMDLTPEQLEEAIAAWKKSHMNDREETSTTAADEEEKTADSDTVPVQAPIDPAKPAGSSVEEKLAQVKRRRDQRSTAEDPADLEGARGIITQQDEDLDVLTACLETLLAERASSTKDCGPTRMGDCGGVCKDSSDSKGKALNADAADDIIRQRLSICRVGDRLALDGLEDLSIMDGKKAIIGKVLPNIRLDGKSPAYIDACYDLAVGEAGKRRDVGYQRRQMGHGAPATRNDGDEGVSMAVAARQRMLDREGGDQ